MIAAFANYCELMSLLCDFEPACCYEAADSAGCLIVLQSCSLLFNAVMLLLFLLFALVLIMNEPALLWLISRFIGGCLAGAL